MVIDNPEEVLRLALPEDHRFFRLFRDPAITNIYQPAYHADRIDITAIANDEVYRCCKFISDERIYRASRESDWAFGSEVLREMADMMVQDIDPGYTAMIGPLIRGHSHTATYLDEALRMPDNVSNTHPPDEWGSFSIAETNRRINGTWETEEASEKARELLFSLLTEEQQEEYLEHQRIIVLSEKGNLYNIRRLIDSNVYLLNSNDPDDWNTRYCAGISHYVPLEDNLAAQILMLQANEEEFIRIANVVDSRLPEEQYRIYIDEASLGNGSRVRIDRDGTWRPVVET